MTTRLLDHKFSLYRWTSYVLIALIIPFHGNIFTVPAPGADAGHSSAQGSASLDRDAPRTTTSTPPAFPGAEGFGANTAGGRGGKIFEVTNLNDSGSGSLRACVDASGARICVFRTGGLIQLKSALRIVNPYITIAGQTAPGGGITLKTVSGGDALTIGTHDVIIRYMTFRPGPGGENHGTEIASNGVHLYNIMIDHCSFSWGTDEVLETWYKVSDTTIQWSIVSEGLDCSTHSKGCHSKGLMVGGYAASESGSGLGSENISVHHNLFAHNGERNPLVQTSGLVDVVNNVAYNPFGTFMYLYMKSKSVVPVNYVGNYYKYGPNTSAGKYEIKTYDDGGTGAKIYVADNIGPHRTSDSQAQQNVVDSGSRTYLTQTRHNAPSVTTTSAPEAYKQVLATSGNNAGLSCKGAWVVRRDAIDARVVKDVSNGTGAIIDNPAQVGGWITPASGTPCQDADHDGMPDVWETGYGLNPKNNADAVTDLDRDGYTNVEEYINGTDPASKGGSPDPTTIEKIPTPLAPAKEETLLHRRPAFDWTDISDVTSYQIIASRSSSFSTVLWKVNTTTSTYTPPADLPGGKVIYWRVRAKIGTDWSPWSETWSFTTARSPSIPVLVSPANKAITRDYTPRLKWKPSTIPSGGAAFDHYQVQVSVDKGFPDPLLIDVSDVTTSSYSPDSDLAPNDRYYWRVRSFNVDGQYSSWSTVRSFSTPLLSPTNLTPNNDETVGSRQPVLDWDMVEGASGYTLQISTNSKFSTLLVNAKVTADTFTPSTNLPANRSLYWRVRATGPNGPSNWTSASFHTP